MANTVVNRLVLISQAVIALALTLFIALTVATVIAIDKSRDRTACLGSAQTVEQCPVPSWWENLLRKAIAPQAEVSE